MAAAKAVGGASTRCRPLAVHGRSRRGPVSRSERVLRNAALQQRKLWWCRHRRSEARIDLVGRTPAERPGASNVRLCRCAGPSESGCTPSAQSSKRRRHWRRRHGVQRSPPHLPAINLVYGPNTSCFSRLPGILTAGNDGASDLGHPAPCCRRHGILPGTGASDGRSGRCKTRQSRRGAGGGGGSLAGGGWRRHLCRGPAATPRCAEASAQALLPPPAAHAQAEAAAAALRGLLPAAAGGDGPGPGRIVAVFVPRSAAYITAVLAAVFSG